MPEPPKVREKGREPQVQANVPEPPLKMHHQGRELQVEDHLGQRDAAARHTGYQTRSGRVIREPSRYRDFRK